MTKFLLPEDHPLQLLTLAVNTGGRYEKVKRLYALFIQESKETALRVVVHRENQLLLWIYNAMMQLSGVLEDATQVFSAIAIMI